MKKLLILLSLFLNATLIFADTSGNGCKIGQGYIYTQYLGEASAYTGTPPIKYYNSNGPKVPFYWGPGYNEVQGYRCGYINVYGASSYYDYDKKQNVYIPAEQEFNFLGPQCVIAPSLGATPVQTDSYVSYSYNKTNKCAVAPPQNVPLDDYIWLLMVGFAAIGTYFLRKNLMLAGG